MPSKLVCCKFCGRDTKHPSGVCWHCVTTQRNPWRAPWEPPDPREVQGSDEAAKEAVRDRRESEDE